MSAGDWKELYQAAITGREELVRYHLAHGVDPNYQHPEVLSTPLVGAILGGHTGAALVLLEHGADPRLRSFFDDLTPLEAAKRMRDQEVLRKLLDRGVTPRGARLWTWLSGWRRRDP